MNRFTKFLAGTSLMLGAALLTSAWLPRQQGGAQDRDPFYQAAVLNFSVLQMVSVSGEARDIPASTISKLWLLARPDGGIRLEVTYENGDYSSFEVADFHLIRRSANSATPSVDIPVRRSSLSDMAFPEFRN